MKADVYEVFDKDLNLFNKIRLVTEDNCHYCYYEPTFTSGVFRSCFMRANNYSGTPLQRMKEYDRRNNYVSKKVATIDIAEEDLISL